MLCPILRCRGGHASCPESLIIKHDVPPDACIGGGRANANVESVESSPCNADPPFMLDRAQPLNPTLFPNSPRIGNTQIPGTIPNVQHLLASYGIIVRYNTIRKKLAITVPGQSGTPDNADNVAMSQVIKR